RFALRRGISAARLEALLAAASDPRAALQGLARQSGWTGAEVITEPDPERTLAATRHALEREASRHQHDDDPIVSALRGQPLEPERWNDLGQTVVALGDFEVAIRWLTAAVNSLPEGASPLSLVTLLAVRGLTHQHAGNFVSARADLERSHTLALVAGDATAIARSADSLAYVLLAQGEPQRAREHLESALSITAELGDSAEVAGMLAMLGMALKAQGDLAGARRTLEQALSIRRRVFASENHPLIALTMSALGSVLVQQGDVKGGCSYLERSLEIHEQLAGSEHPDAATTLYLLGVVDRVMGNSSRARARLERALAIQRLVLGSDEHPEIADTLVELARVLEASGDLESAQAMLERALAIQQKSLGGDGQLVGAMTRRTLADVLVAKGDLAAALGHLERALPTLRRIFERDDHPEIAAMRRELERLQRLQRDLQRTD
ncbi:MAG TPA: tetratricopeptide repeat protein, partial [Kofleriaceae bacterium]